jgi:hypothetical protein
MNRRIVWLLAAMVLGGGCKVVSPHQREHLAHPSMKAEPDTLEARRRKKLHTAREGAAGGDGKPAGGGCGCSN